MSIWLLFEMLEVCQSWKNEVRRLDIRDLKLLSIVIYMELEGLLVGLVEFYCGYEYV